MVLTAGQRTTISVDLCTIKCCNCYGIFAVTDHAYNHYKQTGHFFNCPYCDQSQHYTKSEISKLQDRINTLENTRKYYIEQLGKETRSKIAIKGHHTRLKKRIAAGVCPCCNRSFQNLQSHMKNQHPQYLEE